MSELPGGDTLGIVTMAPSGQFDSLQQPILTESVVWVYGCVFDTQHVTEHQDDTITSRERGWCWLPYVAGVGIPTVNADGTPALDGNGNPITVDITNACWVRPKRADPMGQRDYKVFGEPVLEYDLDGQPDHVWVTCEWQPKP